MIILRPLPWLACAASMSFLPAQHAKFDLPAALRRGGVSSERHESKLAFDYTGWMLRVVAKIGGRECRMLLDTGAPMIVPPALAKQLALEPLGSLPIRDSNNNARGLMFVVLPAVDVGGVVYSDLVAAVVDLQATPILRELGIDGMIGGNLLRLGGLAIDYPNHTSELAATAASLQPNGKGASFAPDDQGSPHLEMQLGARARECPTNGVSGTEAEGVKHSSTAPGCGPGRTQRIVRARRSSSRACAPTSSPSGAAPGRGSWSRLRRSGSGRGTAAAS
jgi:hypothetical protein